ncbi:mitochondrial cytochrome b2-like protein [Clavulina sp. PMI_390]|nr:mitochondrial cytochrome b2-like protein [Clavulina sp. PMI_390]
MLSAQEVSAHSTRESCWVIIAGQVYDLTEFLEEHPGGSAIILRYAGQDATQVYEEIHPPTALEDNIPQEKRLGPVDLATVKQPEATPAKTPVQTKSNELPSLSTIISLEDFENVGRERLSKKAWAYFFSGATDMTSLALNRSSWNSILFVPRVMVDVTQVDTSTTIAGEFASLPVIIAPTGMSKLSHPMGEMGFAEGAGLEKIPFTVSTNASAGLDQIVAARGSDAMTLLFQLYVNKDRPKSTALLQRIASYKTDAGVRLFKAIVVTVDCPAPGKREPDERVKAEVDLELGVTGAQAAAPDAKGGGIGRAMGGFIDPKVTWADIAWIREQVRPVLTSSSSSSSSASASVTASASSTPSIPIGVKGIQCVADALLAIHHGAQIIWLSNHGGRGLDTAPPALYVLAELRRDHPWVFQHRDAGGRQVEFYIDGGVRRGTDIVKALCLGARAVVMGRPFLYALQWGTQGVRHAVDILRDEMETTMRLIGATKVSDLGPHLLNVKALQPLLNDPIPVPPEIQPAVKARL